MNKENSISSYCSDKYLYSIRIDNNIITINRVLNDFSNMELKTIEINNFKVNTFKYEGSNNKKWLTYIEKRELFDDVIYLITKNKFVIDIENSCLISNILNSYFDNYIVVSNGIIALCNENILDISNNKNVVIEIIRLLDNVTVGYIYFIQNKINVNVASIYQMEALNMLKIIIKSLCNNEYNIEVNTIKLEK